MNLAGVVLYSCVASTLIPLELFLSALAVAEKTLEKQAPYIVDLLKKHSVAGFFISYFLFI